MKNYRELLQARPIPAHVAIIMDGNGRWAKNRSLQRIEGHRQGTEVIEPVMEEALDLGIRAVSLYAFSTENWSRPRPEILGLWNLLEDFFHRKLDRIMEKGIRLKHSGSLSRLPGKTRKIILNALERTSVNDSIILNLCLNYGGRQDIIQAVNSWLQKRKEGQKITEKRIERELSTADLPPVDLLIRTSGEYRISNFMLWQMAYTELYFTETLWPDFGPADLDEAVYVFQQRDRRFGGL
jgi:undecaprenyl diphosphate synthase